MTSTGERLALLGGTPAVSRPLPHEIWPPRAEQSELAALAAQRNDDISIKGSSGPVRELEDAFRAFLDHQVRWAITFNSGTSALLAAYFALGVREGVEVVGPALTYHAALSPVHALRGEVALADIDVRTRGLDPDSLERTLTERTKVITVVHQWGHPCDMDAILRIADKHRLRVLEDCSHAHGSRYKGKLCGTFGDAAVFSLQANKAVFAGEGGILVTNDDGVHDRATLLGHYRDRSRDEVVDQELRQYWVTGFGLKLRMSPFNAIVALHSLAAFPERKQARHSALGYFGERLAEVDYIEPMPIDDEVDMGAWYGYKPLFRPEEMPGVSRTALISALRAEGMEVGAPSGPRLSTLPLYAGAESPLFPGIPKAANAPIAGSVAELVEQRALSLPTFTEWPADKDLIDQYIAAFQKVGRHRTALAEHAAASG
ncbi:DegT/DnrJ/EryC1/StrS family aminotransferase [Streptomyces sp. NPDC057743]|uniref:DegT/DnrJ/EryC1/StrS aminotransferase family protein n=1 Tax=Streptomyces sp. NPDC057743 TaxID=3346236 RepID=UPI0036BAC317